MVEARHREKCSSDFDERKSWRVPSKQKFVKKGCLCAHESDNSCLQKISSCRYVSKAFGTLKLCLRWQWFAVGPVSKGKQIVSFSKKNWSQFKQLRQLKVLLPCIGFKCQSYACIMNLKAIALNYLLLQPQQIIPTLEGTMYRSAGMIRNLQKPNTVKHVRFTLCWSQDDFWLITQLWSKIEQYQQDQQGSTRYVQTMAS